MSSCNRSRRARSSMCGMSANLSANTGSRSSNGGTSVRLDGSVAASCRRARQMFLSGGPRSKGCSARGRVCLDPQRAASRVDIGDVQLDRYGPVLVAPQVNTCRLDERIAGSVGLGGAVGQVAGEGAGLDDGE